MIHDETITRECSRVSLRGLTLDDCSEKYVNWLHDKRVNRYLEARWSTHTIESCKQWVDALRKSSNNLIFAILYDNDHVGNIKIGSIHPKYKYADIGFFIGETGMWGKGIATVAVNMATEYAFFRLKLHRLWGGVAEANIGSQRTFEKNNYMLEGISRDQMYVEAPEKFCNIHYYGILENEFHVLTNHL